MCIGTLEPGCALAKSRLHKICRILLCDKPACATAWLVAKKAHRAFSLRSAPIMPFHLHNSKQVEGQRSLYARLAHMPALALKKAPGISNTLIFL
jgi:hypothetical protein